MITITHNKQTLLLAFSIGFAYLTGILSISHDLPSNADFFPNLQASFFLVAGLVVWFVFSWRQSYKVQQFSLSSITWLYLAVVVGLQPVLNDISYPDGLVFGVASLFLMFSLSVAVANVANKKILVNSWAIVLVVGAGLTFFTQLAQVFAWQGLWGTLVMPPQVNRAFGNIGQPNQAAYILALGMAAVLYGVKLNQSCGRANQWVRYFLLASLFLSLAVGLGLTASRGGLILAVAAVVGYGVFFQNTLKTRLISVVVAAVLVTVGYNLGAGFMQAQLHMPTAVERMSQDTFSLRVYQFQQAWVIFLQDPLLGIGWRNFAKGGLENAQQLDWFVYNNHSHFFVSHLASELGVVGLVVLVPLAIIVVKNLTINLPAEKAMAMLVVGLTLLYSCSEYPLWFVRFLLVFVVFLAVLDDSNYKLKFNYKPVFAIVHIGLLLAVVYYYVAYKKYSHVAYTLANPSLTATQQLQLFQTLPNVVGFNQYQEMILYYLLEPSAVNSAQKAAVGERVLAMYPSRDYIVKQATFLAFSGQQQRALTLYQAACVYDFAKQCADVARYLTDVAALEPQHFAAINQRFYQWRQQYPIKTQLE